MAVHSMSLRNGRGKVNTINETENGKPSEVTDTVTDILDNFSNLKIDDDKLQQLQGYITRAKIHMFVICVQILQH